MRPVHDGQAVESAVGGKLLEFLSLVGLQLEHVRQRPVLGPDVRHAHKFDFRPTVVAFIPRKIHPVARRGWRAMDVQATSAVLSPIRGGILHPLQRSLSDGCDLVRVCRMVTSARFLTVDDAAYCQAAGSASAVA